MAKYIALTNLYMSDDIQVTYGDELSPEQKERLAGLEGEAPEEEKKEEPLMEEKPEDTPRPKKKESKEEEIVNDDESDDDDDDLEEEDKPTRKSKFVNLDKHKKMRDRAKEAEEELATLKTQLEEYKDKPNQANAEDLISSIDEYADEFGVSKESVSKLLKLAEEGAYKKVKDEFGSKLTEFEEATKSVREAEADATQEKLWRKDLETLKEKYPDEDIEAIRGKLKQHYFSEDYSKTPIDVIYRGVEGLRPAKGSKTVEKGRGGTSKDTPVHDFKKILDDNNQEAIQAMDSETFNEFRDYISKRKV
jgi:hypothetical protein